MKMKKKTNQETLKLHKEKFFLNNKFLEHNPNREQEIVNLIHIWQT